MTLGRQKIGELKQLAANHNHAIDLSAEAIPLSSSFADDGFRHLVPTLCDFLHFKQAGHRSTCELAPHLPVICLGHHEQSWALDPGTCLGTQRE